jgi:hypothetical protein
LGQSLQDFQTDSLIGNQRGLSLASVIADLLALHQVSVVGSGGNH